MRVSCEQCPASADVGEIDLQVRASQGVVSYQVLLGSNWLLTFSGLRKGQAPTPKGTCPGCLAKMAAVT